jgi:DNA-binding SARP family transcriptional activator
MTISINLLGPPEVLRDGAALAIPRRKSRALLFYLAARRVPTPRDTVLDLFWPDTVRPAAQQTLRSTIYGLRQVLGPLVLAGETLALAPGSDVDVWQLDDGLANGAPAVLAAALARVRGPFLAGFSLPDTPEFDDWVAALRERYHADMVGGFAALGRAHEADGEFHAALDALERALALDPLREDVQRDAMRVQYRAGDRVGAIRRYEQLRKRLDDELGIPPMAETQAVYDAIIKDEGTTLNDEDSEHASRMASAVQRAPGLQPPRGHPALSRPEGTRPSLLPFTGRQIELQAVRQMASARQLVLVEGEPGIGKTRLVEEFLRGANALVLRGAARELDQALPYQPVVEALRTLIERPDWPALRERISLPTVWLNEAGRLAPELASSQPPAASPAVADEARLREGVSQLLRALAQFRPLVLFIDDAHWADAATLGLLGYLVRQQMYNLTLIITAHPFEPRSPLALLAQNLTREGRLARLRLARLGEDDTHTLARQLSPAAADALASWLLRNAEGNPYVLAELVRSLRDEQMLQADGTLRLDRLQHDAPVVPPTVYTLIASRLARLSAPARAILDAAVAAGREFDSAVVAHAAGLSDEAALDALDELVAAGLVLPLDEQRLAFDHSLTMEVAYKEVGEARHRLVHRRVGEALEALHREALDEVAGQIAMHYLESRAVERAAPYALRAARRAVGLAAWTEAIGFFRQALDGMHNGERGAVLLELGTAYHRSGDSARAVEVFNAAVVHAGDDQLAAALARLELAQALINQGRFGDVLAIAREIAADERIELAARGELLWGTGLSIEGADLQGAAEHLRRAEQLTLAAQAAGGRGATLAHAYFEHGSVLAQQGELDAAIAYYQRTLDASDESSIDWRILAHNNIAYHLHLLGDPQAERHARTGLAIAQERGAVGYLPFLYSTLGEIALAQGELALAEQQFGEGLVLAERLAMPERIAGLGANLGLVAARRGQTALAIHRLSTALARADALGIRHLAAQIRIWLAPLLPPEEAQATLTEARAIAEAGGRRRLLEQIVLLQRQIER